ncbi:hypothetical protein [Kitasatospora sp. NPDC094015]|uniref:hypothetical protein n=1 Tax=Kitasatospora sp. NPDC094015 TaxID=3155205 RepID=UPI003316D025
MRGFVRRIVVPLAIGAAALTGALSVAGNSQHVPVSAAPAHIAAPLASAADISWT